MGLNVAQKNKLFAAGEAFLSSAGSGYSIAFFYSCLQADIQTLA
jgi:hypothetical protein